VDQLFELAALLKRRPGHQLPMVEHLYPTQKEKKEEWLVGIHEGRQAGR
jgi:hypothetical protein